MNETFYYKEGAAGHPGPKLCKFRAITAFLVEKEAH